jgi:hypothetical protein
MGRGVIGFYVHHHGRGHLTRTACVLRHLHAPATVLTSAPTTGADLNGAEVIALPLDTAPPPPATAGLATPDAFHFAPVGVEGLQRRMAQIATWASRPESRLLVVDVSAEVAVLGRLLSLPVVAVRQHGDRTDAAHRLAYESAAALLAPYPAFLEDPAAPSGVREKTIYAGGFSRFDGRIEEGNAAASGRRVVVLSGGGGDGLPLGAIGRAARACPDWTWTVLGETRAAAADLPPSVEVAGWTADPFPHLLRACVVVASAGHNGVMEVAAARRPLIAIAEPRPFDEQAHKAAVLEREGLALACPTWPDADAWPDLLTRARTLGGDAWRRVVDGWGAVRAARALDRLHEQFGRGDLRGR